MIQFVEPTAEKRFKRRRLRMQGPKEKQIYEATFPDPRQPGKPDGVTVPVAYHWETTEVAQGAFFDDLVFEPNEQAALAPGPKPLTPTAADAFRKEITRLRDLIKELGQAPITDESPEAAKAYIRKWAAQALDEELSEVLVADLDASDAQAPRQGVGRDERGGRPHTGRRAGDHVQHQDDDHPAQEAHPGPGILPTQDQTADGDAGNNQAITQEQQHDHAHRRAIP